MIRFTRRFRLTGLLLAGWLTGTADPQAALITGLTAALRRRLAQLRTARDRGLTTVEVALITAVLLGLATALLVTITAVVTKNTNKIK